jgi:pyrimidine operon attenuation protein/uracil phosphoribosyltransferase
MTGSPVELEPILEAKALAKVLHRMASEMVEKHSSLDGFVLAGIPTRGVEVARRLLAEITRLHGGDPELGILDISMHRDDLATRERITAIQTTSLPVDLEGRTVILVDDVLFTGRSIRAAMDALGSYGRTGRIELAVLVDRGHRQLPIHPDYVGREVPTKFNDRIRVRFENLDGVPDSVHRVIS